MAATPARGADPATGAFSWSPGSGLRSLARGGVHELRLFPGARGRNLLLSAASRRATQGAGLAAAPVIRLQASGLGVGEMSLRGSVVLRGDRSPDGHPRLCVRESHVRGALPDQMTEA